jgi:aldose 1-epimerase
VRVGQVAPPSGEQWTIAADGHEAVIVEVGGGLRSYRCGGSEVVDSYAKDEVCPACAGQILAPWPNRIRDGRYTFDGLSQQLALTEPVRHNAIHGLVNWSRWRAAKHSTDELTVEYDLPPQPGYPWPLSLQTTWRVGPDGLRADHTVTNVAARPAPFGFSVHPYLIVPGVPIEELVLHLPARSRLLVDGRLLPIGAARVAGSEYDFTEPRRLGAQVIDTAFGDVIRSDGGGSAVTLRAPDGRGVRIWADAGFGWWQVFTSDTLVGARHRRSVAVEPMTCPPDAFRSGRDLIALDPGQSWQGSWGIAQMSAGA